MRDKPLELLQVLLPFIRDTKDELIVVPKKGTLYHLIDKDPTSAFYYSIIKTEQLPMSGMHYLVEHVPHSASIPGPDSQFLHPSEINDSLYGWLFLMRRYLELEAEYADPNEKKYKEDLLSEWKLVDDDADISPFDDDRILALLDLVGSMEQVVHEEGKITDKERILLLHEAQIVKEAIAHEPKNKALDRLFGFMARCKRTSLKLGVRIIKKFTELATNAAFQKAFDKGWDKAIEIVSQLKLPDV